jgi:antitoxin PrlF
VLAGFLDFLARDIAAHPEHLQIVDANLVARVRALVGDIDVDLHAPLPVDDA